MVYMRGRKLIGGRERNIDFFFLVKNLLSDNFHSKTLYCVFHRSILICRHYLNVCDCRLSYNRMWSSLLSFLMFNDKFVRW